ncbi:MAG: spermidine synthase [Saezia sp.]
MKNCYPEVFFSEIKGVRHLHLGTEDWIQGSMRINKPFYIELEYIRRMMAWLLYLPPEFIQNCHAMQLGLGAAAITKFCHTTLGMHTTAVELNPHVVNICRAWFHLPEEDDKLKIIVGDALDVINNTALNGTVDALCVDIYDDDACAPVIDTVELYTRCKKMLTEQGIMTVNLFGRNNSFSQSLQNIAKAFGTMIDSKQNLIWQFPPTSEGNTVVLAMAKPLSIARATLQERAIFIEEQWKLPATKWLEEIKRPEPVKTKRR